MVLHHLFCLKRIYSISMVALAGLIYVYLVISLNRSKYFLIGLMHLLNPSSLLLLSSIEGVFAYFFHLLAVNLLGEMSNNFVMLDYERLLLAVEMAIVFAEGLVVARKIFVLGIWLDWDSSRSFPTLIFFHTFSRTDISLVIVLRFSLPACPSNY